MQGGRESSTVCVEGSFHCVYTGRKCKLKENIWLKTEMGENYYEMSPNSLFNLPWATRKFVCCCVCI